MDGTNWTCPFCGHFQTLTEGKYQVDDHGIYVGKNAHGKTSYRVTAIGCSNPDCGEINVQFYFGHGVRNAHGNISAIKDIIAGGTVYPDSSARPQPDYIPDAIRNDYYQACRIRDLSPKASATLSRRCLQGMIRDFCGVSDNRLIDEIRELRKQVDDGSATSGVTAESVDAIDHVRSVGNIGAHMEKDINVIIDVEPGEAQALIELIELLFDEWYVARKTRQDRLASVKRIANEKSAAKSISSAKNAADEEPIEDDENTEAA